MQLLSLIVLVCLAGVYGIQTPYHHIHTHLLATPSGLLPPNCVHSLPSGSHVHRQEHGDLVVHPDGSKQFFPHPKAGECVAVDANLNPKLNRSEIFYSGWTTWASYKQTEPMTVFLGSFNVPNDPAAHPNPLYTFTAFQNIDWVPVVNGGNPSGAFDIIQPVLGYFGEFWQIASWIVSLDGGNTYHSNWARVKAGTELFGNMTKIGSSEWYIDTVANGEHTRITTHTRDEPDNRLNNQIWAYTAVECYQCSSCQTYPTNSLVFKEMSIKSTSGVVTPSWTAHEGKYHWCNEKCAINSASENTYTFQKN